MAPDTQQTLWPAQTAPAAGRYLAVMAAVAMSALSLAGLLNLAIDPGEQFRRPVSHAALNAFAKGKAVVYDKNLDLRLINRRLIEREPPPEIVLLGSSVTANIGGPMISIARPFRNLSVNGGTLVDHVSLLGAYEQKGQWPKRVILWLDGLSFQTGHSDPRWAANADLYDQLTRSLGVTRPISFEQSSLQTLRQVLSWSYTRLSLETVLRHGLSGKMRSYPSTVAPDSARFMYPDGSRSWGKARAGAGVRAKALKAVEEGLPVSLYTAFDADSLTDATNRDMALLDAVLAKLKQHGVEAVLYATPFCPCVLPEMEAMGAAQKLTKLDEAVRSVAERHNARFIGSNVPDAVHPVCPESEYLDYHHLADACHRRYLNEALN